MSSKRSKAQIKHDRVYGMPRMRAVVEAIQELQKLYQESGKEYVGGLFGDIDVLPSSKPKSIHNREVD